MLICVECEAVFETPKRVVERHGLDTPPYEEFDACPYCGGINLHTAKQCDMCGAWLTGSYIVTLDGQRICDDCCLRRDVEDDD